MSRFYDINYQRIGLLLLPTFMRAPLISALVKAMMLPIYNQHRAFNIWRGRLGVNACSQVCRLESLLNDRYDYYRRRIKICDITPTKNDGFLFDKNPIYVSDESPVFWYDPADASALGVDFEVVISADVKNTAGINALINNNKLASKKYSIRYE